MGYTHYWRVNNQGDQQAYSDALIDMAEIVRQSPVPLGNNHGESGGPELTDRWLGFNGIDEAAHETALFYARLADYEQPEWNKADGSWVFNFCKTARKPYDVVVTAVLCRLAECGTDNVIISSDGEAADWEAGQRLATGILGRPVAIPANVIEYVEA